MIPLTLSLFFGYLLLALCVFQKEPSSKLIVLSILNIFLTVFFIENLFRSLVINENSITHNKFLRRKTLLFSEINSFESLSLRKRMFSTLSTEESFLIFSNVYQNFEDLMRQILARLPENSVSQETKELATSPPVKRGDIISFWIAALVLGGILLQQASIYIK